MANDKNSIFYVIKKIFLIYLSISVLFTYSFIPAYAETVQAKVSTDKIPEPQVNVSDKNFSSHELDPAKNNSKKEEVVAKENTASTASGSNAFNYQSTLAENVDARTGTVTLNLPVVTIPGISGLDLKLSLTYNPADLSNPFGIAKGWKLNLPYIDVINGTKLHLANGASYLYQPASNNYSHLQYYELNNLTVSNKSGVIGDGRSYSYKVTYLSGMSEFLDGRGRIIERADRFGNKIVFHYGVNDQGNYLTEIIDTYGNKVLFQINQQGVTTVTLPTQPGQPIKQLQYSTGDQGGIYRISNTNHEVTRIYYQTYNNLNQPSTIIYPNELQTKITYQPIPFKNANGTGSLYVAKALLHLDSQGNNIIAPVNYSIGGIGLPNFTGYPKYATTANSDLLLQSNDATFTYQTSSVSGNKKSINTYNSRHLLIRKEIQDVTQASNPVTFERKVFNYIGANSNYPNLAPNYQMPQQITSTFYSRITKGQRIVQETADYDLNGNEIQHAYYNGSVVTKPIKETTTTYDYNYSPYGIPCNQTVQAADGTNVTKIIELTLDKKNIQSQIVGSATRKLSSCGNQNSFFSANKQTSYWYDPQGRIKQKILLWADGKKHPGPSQILNNYSYDLNGQMLAVTASIKKGDGSSVKTTNTVDITSGNPISHIDGKGYVTGYRYDILNRRIAINYPNATTQTFTYSLLPNGSTYTKTNSAGYVIQTISDVLGRTIKVFDNIASDGSALPAPTRLTTIKTYDFNTGLVQTETNQLKNLTATHYYDIRSREIRTLHADGSTTTTQYDDASGNGLTTTVTSSTITASNEKLPQTIVTINNLKQKTSSRVLAGDIEKNGKVNKRKVSKQLTQPASGLLMNYSYYDMGLIQTSVDTNLNQMKQITPNFASQVLTTSILTDNTNHASVTLNYDTNYDLLNHNTQKNIQYTKFPDLDPLMPSSKTGDIYSYNELGQLVSITNSAAQTNLFTYDDNGNLASKTDLAGRIWHYNYDNMNRLIESYYNLANNSTKYADKIINYDTATGRVTNIYYVADLTSKVIYQYFFDGSLKSKTYAHDNATMHYSYYDYATNTQSVTDYSGVTTTYSFDKFGHLLQAQISVNNWVKYGYYPSFRIMKIERSNGLNTRYSYDGYGQVTDIVNQLAAPKAVIQSAFHYIYDPAEKNIIEVDSSSQSIPGPIFNNIKRYKYDLVNRLYESDEYDATGQKLIKSINYLFDANGNITQEKIITQTEKPPISKTAQSITTIYTYNPIDQLKTIKSTDPLIQGTGTFIFDYGKAGLDGNMTQDNQGNNYSYNDLNQLISFKDKNGNETKYTYYADGLRKSKSQNNYAIYFYYAAQTQINEKDSSNIWASYLLGASGERISRGVNKLLTYFGRNFRGDIVATSDQNSTALTNYQYSDYGLVTSSNQNSSPTIKISDNPFLYSGEYLDKESNLYYLKARYYSPNLMRFVTMDTYQLANKYAYANANPLMNTDSSGHMPEWASSLISNVVGGIVGIIGGIITGGLLAESGVLVATLAGAVIDGITGAAGTAAADGIATATGQTISGKQWGRDIGIGAAVGAILGGISAGATAYYKGVSSVVDAGEELGSVVDVGKSDSIELNNYSKNYFSRGGAVHGLPNLEEDNYNILGNISSDYNCMAYACGIKDEEIWFGGFIKNHDIVFENLGFKKYDLEDFDVMQHSDNGRAIAAYRQEGLKQSHYALYNFKEKMWESKLGMGPLINHATLEQLNSDFNGYAYAIYHKDNVNIEDLINNVREAYQLLGPML